MDKVIEIALLVYNNLHLVVGLLTSIIAIAMVIPGEQPEKFLQSVVDFIKKWSKK